MQILLDSGLMVSMNKISALLLKVIRKTISETRTIVTLARKIHVKEVVTIRDLSLPEFDKTIGLGNKRL